MSDLVLVLPFCSRDGALALKNLLWMEELDGKLPFECVLSHDDQTPGVLVQQMTETARRIFNKVDVFWYPAPSKKHWPAAPNCAWQNVARYMEAVIKKPWLFLEADAVPIRKGWLHDIATEHQRVGKPFSGHIVDGMGHLNGSCVYPPNVSMYSVDAFRVEETAWDVVLGNNLALREGGMSVYAHAAHTLFQHCWAINAETGRAWNGHGEVATFKNLNDVLRLVDVTMALFHRCKDGTLIDQLRIYHKDPSAAMVPQHTKSDETTKHSDAENVPRMDAVVLAADARPADCAEPRETANAASEAATAPFTGKCEIFIVTYGLPTKRPSGLIVSDFDWLAWCLRCIRKHCQGFAGITLAIPGRDAALLKPLADEHAQSACGIPLKIKLFKEPPGKGMLAHMALMGNAETQVPKDTTHVLHVDSDVMFNREVTPSSYIPNGKPRYVIRTYASLAEMRDGQQVVSDCIQWLEPTKAQLGFDPEFYTMCCHPTCFPIGFYEPYRKHIEKTHGKPYSEYMVSGRNEHPASRMDFTAMGAWAYRFMRDQFEWIDISGGNHLAPKEFHRCFWSHGSVTDHIKTEMEGFLK